MGGRLIQVMLSVATAAFLLLPGIRAQNFEQTCSHLSDTLTVENATIETIDLVSAGTNLTFPNVDPSCRTASQVVPVDICRVQMTLATSDRSSTFMEAWLPRNWTGRFLATGNGGIGGCIQYADLAYGAKLGFAASGSNNGHSGQNGTKFLGNIEVVRDFAWRALHSSAEAGKKVSEQFYGDTHNTSYYLGCSTGGRQGLNMAENFASSFDGIVAGAPAVAFSNLTSWSGRFYSLIKSAGPDGVPPPEALAAIDQALLEQCDGLDGAMDGILEDPSLCNFRPESLTCPSGGAGNSTCLTSRQVSLVRGIFSPLYGKDGDMIYPRLQPGPGLTGAILNIYGVGSQFLYTDHWFKYAVYNDPDLDTSHLTPEQMAYAWNSNPGNSNTWSGDLSGAKKSGTKILHYHGQADPLISSAISNEYYDHVVRTMGIPNKELDAFYRFFRIGGMGHCTGGAGAVNIGNMGMTSASLEPDENVLMAMVRWVEEGVAPEAVTGSAFMHQNPSEGIDFKRKHCRYPMRNVYSGSGDEKDVSSWECVL